MGVGSCEFESHLGHHEKVGNRFGYRPFLFFTISPLACMVRWIGLEESGEEWACKE